MLFSYLLPCPQSLVMCSTISTCLFTPSPLLRLYSIMSKTSSEIFQIFQSATRYVTKAIPHTCAAKIYSPVLCTAPDPYQINKSYSPPSTAPFPKSNPHIYTPSALPTSPQFPPSPPPITPPPCPPIACPGPIPISMP